QRCRLTGIVTQPRFDAASRNEHGHSPVPISVIRARVLDRKELRVRLFSPATRTGWGNAGLFCKRLLFVCLVVGQLAHMPLGVGAAHSRCEPMLEKTVNNRMRRSWILPFSSQRRVGRVVKMVTR